MSQSIAHSLRNKWRSTDIKLDMKYTFSMLVKNRKILTGLKSEGFRRPSPVQVLSISPAHTGRDMIVQSKSGTGKTCLFVITALERVTTRSPDLQVLIITPTREIAVQVQQVASSIGKYFEDLNCEVFIGGLPTYEDIAKLRNCQIAVGTPGRLKYLIEQQHMNTHSVELLILDEADCLLESSFLKDIKFIISHLPQTRQIMAVSATYKDKVMSTFLEYMRDAKIIRVYEDELTLKGVLQFFHVLEIDEHEKIYERKLEIMLSILNSVSFAQCMVFSISVTEVLMLCRDLRSHGHSVNSICGQDGQNRRLLTIAELKECKIKILVTTDLTARGIDAENVDLVLSMDPGFDMETYVHRVGRAGRYGSRGVAVTLVTKGPEVQRLLFYKVSGDFPVYPLPDPIPHDLKKYVPSTPALGEALFAYDVKRKLKIDKRVTKKSQKGLKDRKKENEEQESEDSQSDSSFEQDDAVDDTLLTSVEITNSPNGNSNMPLNDDKLPEGDILSTEEAVIEGNNSVQQNLSTGSSDLELVVDEWSCPSSSKGNEVCNNDHMYCKVLNNYEVAQNVEEGTVTSSKYDDSDLVESGELNSAAKDRQKLDGTDILKDIETGNCIKSTMRSEVVVSYEQNGFISCVEGGSLVYDNEESKPGMKHEICNVNLSKQYKEEDIYFDNLKSCSEVAVQELENDAEVPIPPVDFFYQTDLVDFSSSAFFFDSVQPVQEKNLLEPVLACEPLPNSETASIVEDLEKDDLTNRDAESSDALNAPNTLASGNSNFAVCSSDLQHIDLPGIKNAESVTLDTKEVDMKPPINIANDKMKETDCNAVVKKTKMYAKKTVKDKVKTKNKTNEKTRKPKPLNYENPSLQSYMQMRFDSSFYQNKKKSDKKTISDLTIQSPKTDKKESKENTYTNSSSHCELFDEKNCLKLEGKNEPSGGTIPKQKQRIQSDRKAKDKSEVSKLLVNKSHGDHKHREVDHQSKDLYFPTPEIHKEKKYVLKAHKKADHHDYSTNTDSDSDNHGKLQGKHRQKTTTSTYLGHAHKEHREMDHQSRDLSFPTSEIHKEKKNAFKAHKKVDHHDYKSDNHCELQGKHRQKTTTSTYFGHAHKEHREIDHQSRDLSFPTSEIHKKQKNVFKTHKKADHHYHSANNDYESDNRCKLQGRHRQKTASSTCFGHAHKTRSICDSKCGRKCYSGQEQNFDHAPQKCHECHCSRNCEYCDNRRSRYESIPMPFAFPPFFRNFRLFSENVGDHAFLHEALLLHLSRK